jgi:hypothetical protein
LYTYIKTSQYSPWIYTVIASGEDSPVSNVLREGSKKTPSGEQDRGGSEAGHPRGL